MKKPKLFAVKLITITALIIGLMNTVFIKPVNVGSWKNYAGMFLLLIADFNIVLLVLINRKGEGSNKPYDILLKLFALILPFYFVFYDSLYANQDEPKMKELLRYLLAGFIVYFILGINILYKNDLIG